MQSEIYDKINSKEATVVISNEKDIGSSSSEGSMIESSQLHICDDFDLEEIWRYE